MIESDACHNLDLRCQESVRSEAARRFSRVHARLVAVSQDDENCKALVPPKDVFFQVTSIVSATGTQAKPVFSVPLPVDLRWRMRLKCWWSRSRSHNSMTVSLPWSS